MSEAKTQSAEAASLRSLVEVELWPGEQILCVGQPVPRVYVFAKAELLRRGGVLAGITILMVLYVTLCSTPEVWYTRLETFVVAFLVALALVLGIGFTWFYQDAKGVVYAITNKRSLIFFLVTPVQLDTGRLHPWNVRPRQDGTGDLAFPGITFYAVPDVAHVTQLLHTHFHP
jgi:hypothetical protein